MEYTHYDKVYAGKTKRHISNRFKEHRNLKYVNAVSSHLLYTGHKAFFDDVKILAYRKTDTELFIFKRVVNY